jgi:predicted RNase H-like nuclease (RuvC/YqgF family)
MGNNLDTNQTPAPSNEPQNAAPQGQQTPTETQTQSNTENKGDVNQPTIAELMSQIAEIKIDNSKLKKANDKLASENASLHKQVNAKLTEEELRAQQKSDEFDELRQELEKVKKENALNKATKRYLSMNMPEALAEKVATAELEGDMETVTQSINTFMDAQKKETEEKVKADFLAKMPNPISGNGDGQIDYEKQYNEKLAAGDINGAILASLQANAQQQAAQ